MRYRLAFTVVEFLVVIAIIGVVCALVLPAIEYARETARRAQCLSNLKQFGIAWQQYHDVHGSLPICRIHTYDPRLVGDNPPCTVSFIDKSLHVGLLPFLEQTHPYDSFNQQLSIFEGENTTLHTTTISVFTCPSDTGAPGPFDYEFAGFPLHPVGVPRLMARTSYSGNFGPFNVTALQGARPDCRVSAELRRQANGVFSDLYATKMRDVTDGLSQTIFMSEKAVGSFKEMERVFPNRAGDHGWWVSGNLGDTLYTAMYPINSYKKIAVGGADGRLFSASSYHAGGVHVALGDGSVRFISETIDSWPYDTVFGLPTGAILQPNGSWSHLPPAGLWQSLSTPQGGEIVSEF